MLPHGRHSLFQPPMQLPDQACAHSCAPISDGVAARYTSLDPTTTHLENFTKSLGAQLRKTRQAWQSWMSPRLSGPGGDPASPSLGSKSTSECFGMRECVTKELELGHMIQNINEHVQKRACKDKLSRRKGIKQEDPRGELEQLAQTKQQTQKEKQLDQARLLKKKLQRMELQQEEKKQTIGQNNLGTKNLRRTSGFETNNLGTLGHKNIRTNNLECEDQQCTRSPIKLWKILIDTGAEISVAPRSFAEDVQLSPLIHNLELRNADGRAIRIFGVRTVQLLTPGFSFCMTFVIADVEQPLLGLGSLLNSNLSFQLNKHLGHHVSNNLGEKIQLEQRGLQLYLNVCPAKLGFDLPNTGNLLNNSSLLPEANLGPSNLQLEKEELNQGGVHKSLPLRSLEQHRIQENKPAIGQQQQALPKAKAKHKKKGQRKVANKLSNWEKNDYFEKLQLELLQHQDPRASLDQNTGKHLSLRILVILSLMNKWQLQTLRIQAAWPQELTKTKLRELGIKESKVDSDIMVGYKLVVFQHDDCLLIGGEKMQQESFYNKLSASFNPTKPQQLGEGTPLSFLNTLLELNQADRTISLHPTQAFYQQLLGRYSLEDAKGGETPTLELDRKCTKKNKNKLGC